MRMQSVSDRKRHNVAPVGAFHSASEFFTPVRPSVAAAGKPRSMAAEPAGPVSAPPSPSPEGKLSSGGGPGTLRPAGSPPLGFTLGYPSSQTGPIELDTQVRGQRMLSLPDIETSTSLVLSGSGVPSVGTPAAVVCRPAAVTVAAAACDGCSRDLTILM